MRTFSYTYNLIHLVLGIAFRAEQLVRSGGHKLLDHVGKEEKIIEKESIQLLIALGLENFAAVQDLPWPQAVGQGVENYLLKMRRHTVIGQDKKEYKV